MNKISVSLKLAGLFIFTGVITLVGLFSAYLWTLPATQHKLEQPLMDYARIINDVIDRNLFERYGDVQAFTTSPFASDPAQWNKIGQETQLSLLMDRYIELYGIYKMMLVIDPSGKPVAGMAHDSAGKDVDLKALFAGVSFAKDSWFADAVEGRFLTGADGTTGTVVTGPLYSPYLAKATGGDGLTMIFAAPIKREGQVVGVWVNFFDFSVIESIVADEHTALNRLGMKEIEISLIDNKGVLWVDSQPNDDPKNTKRNPDVIGKLNLAEKGLTAAQEALKTPSGLTRTTHLRKQIEQIAGFARSTGFLGYPGLNWSVLVRVPSEGAFEAIDTQESMMESAALVALLIVVAFGVVVGKAAVKPLERISDTLSRLARGDTDFTLKVKGSDEIATMNDAVNTLNREVRRAFQMQQMIDQMAINVLVCDPRSMKISYANQAARTVLKSIEHLLPVKAADIIGQPIDIFHKNPEHQRRLLANTDNLPHRARVKVGPETMQLEANAIRDAKGTYIAAMLSWSLITKSVRLADRFEEDVLGIAQTVGTVAVEQVDGTKHLAGIAQRTSDLADHVTTTTEEMSANVQTVAAATEELSASIDEISAQVTQAADVAQAALAQAEESSVAVRSLSEAANRIGEVVTLIEMIASQTNLLALNATIEAARAGEAGKGFAVVASEVKALATQTARATGEISSQIQAVQTETEKATQAMDGISSTIERVSQISNAIAAAVEEQTAATREISHNVQVTAVHTQEAANGVAQVRSAVEETHDIAQNMAKEAEQLRKTAAQLTTSVSGFLVEARSV